MLDNTRVVEFYDGHDGMTILSIDQARELLSKVFMWDGNATLHIDYDELTSDQSYAVHECVRLSDIDPFDIVSIQLRMEYLSH